MKRPFGSPLSVLVKGAAKGMATGVHAVLPAAEQRDDCFHVLYELNKVRRQLEQAAQAIAGIDAPGCQKLAGYLANRAPGLSLLGYPPTRTVH